MGGFEVGAGIVRPDDEVFAFVAFFMVADEDSAIVGRGFFGITTIPAGLSFHDLQILT